MAVEILKHGDPEIARDGIVFRCGVCGCIYRAGRGRYRTAYAAYLGRFEPQGLCPECGAGGCLEYHGDIPDEPVT